MTEEEVYKTTADAPEKLQRKIYNEEETEQLFQKFINNTRYFQKAEDKALICKAFEVAKRVHKGQKRYTGDSFLYHLFEVMKIVSEDIGLDTIGATAALLHEITFQTDYKIEDVEQIFGQKISSIIDSLVRIKGTSEYFRGREPEVYKKIILGLADDIRIILIKLADRLENLHTLDVKSPEKQYQVAYETMQIYVPLAHRLGMNKIKTELEELSFKYLNRKAYDDISRRLQISESERKNFINKFTLPIIAKLLQNNIRFDIKGRLKSIYSINQKMMKKHVSFDEVYDKFAIRIIYTSDDADKEKEECLKIVKLIEEDYDIHPERTRDWVNVPKENGYQAYHITVYDPKSKHWVEIQIRSTRMDEIAEYGFAAHWKYKGIKDKKNEFDDKIKLLKLKLENPDNKDFDFLEDFKVLMSDEISVYAAGGKVYTLPSNATVLDFAFITDSVTAENVIGAKVNHKMMPVATTLQNGDLIEIVTASKQQTKPEWLNWVHTQQAFEILKDRMHDFIKSEIAEGQQILHDYIKKYNISNEKEVTKQVMEEFHCLSKSDLFRDISQGKIHKSHLEQYVKKFSDSALVRFWKLQFGKQTDEKKEDSDVSEYLNNENAENVHYELAECCAPLPGDDAIGLMDEKQTIYIHKTNCLYAKIRSKENPRSLIPVNWKVQKEISGTAKISIEGVDQKGILQRIVTLVSQELDLNLKMVHFESDDQSFNGRLEVYVRSQAHLEKLVNKLSEMDGIINIMVEGEELY